MSLPLLPWGWPSMATAGTGAWLSAIYLGLLPSALGFVLWGIAVRALPVAASTSLLYLVPGVAVLIAFLWLGEVPTRGEAVGGLVIVAGVALLTNADRLARHRHRARRASSPLAGQPARTGRVRVGRRSAAPSRLGKRPGIPRSGVACPRQG
jgi:drug/metabolite transporter (DMT)-like permease